LRPHLLAKPPLKKHRAKMSLREEEFAAVGATPVTSIARSCVASHMDNDAMIALRLSQDFDLAQIDMRAIRIDQGGEIDEVPRLEIHDVIALLGRVGRVGPQAAERESVRAGTAPELIRTESVPRISLPSPP